MTVENGCTEGEAISAAAKMAELMDKYGVGFADLEREESVFTEFAYKVFDEVGWKLGIIATAVGGLTGTRVFRDAARSAATKFTFFGREDDVEVAHYILSIAERAIRTELAAFDKNIILMSRSAKRVKRIAFLDGMANSLSKKIRDIDWTRRRAEPPGQSVVELKERKAAAEMRARGIVTKRTSGHHSFTFDPSYGQGAAAAEGVSFNAGMADGRPVGVLPSK